MRRSFISATLGFLSAAALSSAGAIAIGSGEPEFLEVPRSRVIVLTDMGNEADDSQTLVRLLVHSNRFDIEGLIAVSSCHQYAGKNDADPLRNDVQPTMIVERIRAYGQVRDTLNLHAAGWPTEQDLLARVARGPSEYGMLGVGDGRSTSGSRLIAAALTRDDVRPVYVCINAGANCLAQALWDMRRDLDPGLFRDALSRLRVYDDAGQDDAGAWIVRNYPEIPYLRSQGQVFAFMSEQGPVTWDVSMYPGKGQHAWARENVQEGHGPLGRLYPVRRKWKRPDIYHTLEGGGTSTWIGHANRGLYVPEQPAWGGWGGRFDRAKKRNVLAAQLRWADLVETEDAFKPFYMVPEASDQWTDPETGSRYAGYGVPIYRWRRAYQSEFEARMDWCVMSWTEANHHPVAAVDGDRTDRIVKVRVPAGRRLRFDASDSTDPDGDSLLFRWFVYAEAGTGSQALQLTSALDPTVEVKPLASPGQIHLILEVRDTHPATPLFDYRRIVIDLTD